MFIFINNFMIYLFEYLGSQVAADGGCERDVVHRMNEGYRAWGALTSVLSNRGLGKRPRGVYEGAIVPTALYGAEACRGMGYEKC